MTAVMAAGLMVGLTAPGEADPPAAREVVSRVAAEVEADLAGVGGGSGGAPPSFDPLARAQARLAAWTRVPDPGQLVRPLVSSTVGPTVPSGPADRGMVSEYFPRLGTTLTFPASAETARAIRRMARGQVSAIPNRCAGTLREALGWGLGDAHRWTALPRRGYRQRPPGARAQPGDIVVWPFTFGRRNSQHVGIAVGTPAGIKLLSNLSGDLGLSPLVPGYRAYWR